MEQTETPDLAYYHVVTANLEGHLMPNLQTITEELAVSSDLFLNQQITSRRTEGET